MMAEPKVGKRSPAICTWMSQYMATSWQAAGATLLSLVLRQLLMLPGRAAYCRVCICLLMQFDASVKRTHTMSVDPILCEANTHYLSANAPATVPNTALLANPMMNRRPMSLTLNP